MYLRSFLTVLALPVLFAGGCATMNKSECQTADWTMIGMEDGSRGRLSSYIGNHRSACAKFGITPDLDSYQSGHEQGVRHYCTGRNGFARGRPHWTAKGIQTEVDDARTRVVRNPHSRSPKRDLEGTL